MLKDFKECCNAHEQGVNIYPNDGDGYFKLRRLGTPQTAREIEQIRLSKHGLFSGDDETTHMEIMAEWLSEFGVTGWGGINDPETDNEIPFSRSACRQVFSNPAYVGLVGILITEATTIGHFLEANIREMEKELKKP